MEFDKKTADECVDLARVCEAAERYEDMCKAMKTLCGKKTTAKEPLKTEERNLLSVAYKNVVGAKRASWRTLSSGTFSDVPAELVTQFKQQLEKELENTCKEVIALLTALLVNSDKDDETKVFYLKMKGDYYRYLSEFKNSDSDEDKKYKTDTQDCYTKAMDSAKVCLAETHPTRLGLALNFSVCYYEILKKPDEACKLAKEAFDAAIEKLDTLNDASYKDSTLIMQLLRDNLTLWTSENNDDNAAAEPDQAAAGN